jgi:hypothetical protein
MAPKGPSKLAQVVILLTSILYLTGLTLSLNIGYSEEFFVALLIFSS